MFTVFAMADGFTVVKPETNPNCDLLQDELELGAGSRLGKT